MTSLLPVGNDLQAEEEPDEAARYYQKLVQEFPESEFNEKAREQLNIIGAPIPEKEHAEPVFEATAAELYG